MKLVNHYLQPNKINDSVQDHQWMLKPLCEKIVEENVCLVNSTTPQCE